MWGGRTRSFIFQAHSSDEFIAPLLSADVDDGESSMARALEHGVDVAHELDLFENDDVARLGMHRCMGKLTRYDAAVFVAAVVVWRTITSRAVSSSNSCGGSSSRKGSPRRRIMPSSKPGEITSATTCEMTPR